MSIPDDYTVSIGGFFSGYGYFVLDAFQNEFYGPLQGVAKGALSDTTTPGNTNSGCSTFSQRVGAGGQLTLSTTVSQDPVDLFKGNYLYSNTDMTVGSQPEPYSLSFSRSYNSGNAVNNTGLGFGWNHNFQISATPNSDGFIAFGGDNVSAAAAVIAQMYVCQDLLEISSPVVSIANIATISIANKWMMDQIANNTVVVRFGSQAQVFAKLPDGSYMNPLGVNSATVLSLTSGLYKYTTPDKVVYSFNSTGQILTIAYPFGVTVTSAYTSGKLTSVTNGFKTLTLAYTGANLTSITDGTRTVHFTITSNELVSAKDALGNITTYAYGSGTPGLLTQMLSPANPSDAVVTMTFDTLGRVKTQADAYGNVGTFSSQAHAASRLIRTATAAFGISTGLVAGCNTSISWATLLLLGTTG